jgi:hypothetical protein
VGAQFTTQPESNALHTAVTDVNGVYRSFTQGNVLFGSYRQKYIGTHPKDSFRVNSHFHLTYGARWEPLLPAAATHNHGGSDLRILPETLRQHLWMIVSPSFASAPAGDSILYHHHTILRCIFNELAWTPPPSELAQGHPSSKWAVTSFAAFSPQNYDLGPGGVTAIRFSDLTIDRADTSARCMRISTLTGRGAVRR